jgi:hypothetical protein
MAKVTDEISLPQAAHLIGRDYAVTRDLALRGVLQARQVAGRFWLVERESAERFREQHAKAVAD